MPHGQRQQQHAAPPISIKDKIDGTPVLAKQSNECTNERTKERQQYRVCKTSASPSLMHIFRLELAGAVGKEVAAATPTNGFLHNSFTIH